jgi:predicted O-methyltransferase YrrM
MPGIEIDLEAQIGFIERDLAPFAAEFPWRVRGHGYQMWNGLYQAGDAEILYAMVRHLQPRRILEIGSGHSTTITAAALEVNARAGGRETTFVSVDPAPRIELDDDLAGLTRFERGDARELPLERFLELGDGDVLFIDTSHVVKLGSEVNWLVLEVLPRLRPGVYVHIHDVHLPYEYPRLSFVYGELMNEQYLVHAALIGDRSWEVVLALSALAVDYNERFFRVVPSIREPIADLPHLPTWRPSAFWMRRRS